MSGVAVVVLGSALYVLGWNGYHLPDVRLTPGKTREITTVEVCTTTWSRDVRHVSESMKRHVCQRYAARGACPGPGYEIDHLIPRELGGDDHIENLWPQPIKEARIKDVVENWLHRAVCGGSLGIREAQQGLREDWTQEYRKMRDEKD